MPLLAIVVAWASAQTECAVCCSPGGSCQRAFHGRPGVCCGDGQCCPESAYCIRCGFEYRCSRSLHASCDDSNEQIDSAMVFMWAALLLFACVMTWRCWTVESRDFRASTPILTPAGHPQYIFDIIQSFTWGILAGGLTRNLLAMLYPIYITILLVHRCIRDERRCSKKYGEAYSEYCLLVPYRMIPRVW